MSDSDASTGDWLRGHPYLETIARLQSIVEAAAGVAAVPAPAIADWSGYADEFHRGVPVLGASSIALDRAAAGVSVGSLVDALVARGLPDPLAAHVVVLRDELRSAGSDSERIVAWLQGDEAFAPSSPGLFRWLGWTALASHFAPVLRGLDAWRDDERWMRRYCPFCGVSPAMAQLAGTDPGRRRFLSCGGCRASWCFRRTECPFCEHDSQQLASLAVEGEAHLRIDWCESCRGYLKTYDGAGDERLLLADWSSLHLDVIALDRGLERKAVSLYDLPSTVTSIQREERR